MVIGISLDRAEPQTLKPFVKRHDIRYPIGVDTQHEAAAKYGVRGTPTSYLVSPQGTLLGGAQGPRPWDSPATHNLFQHLLSDAS